MFVLALKRVLVILFMQLVVVQPEGPRGSCKHIAALTYGLSEFYKMFEHALPLTCTGVTQKWNKPRAKKVNLIPVDELGKTRR